MLNNQRVILEDPGRFACSGSSCQTILCGQQCQNKNVKRFHGDWAMKEASQNMSRAYSLRDLRAATEKNHIPPWWQVVHEMWLGVFWSSLESLFYDVHPMARNSSASRLGLRWDDLAETPQGWKIVQLLWCFAYVCMGFGGLEEKVGICILVSSSDMLATGYRHACHSMLLVMFV